MKFFFLVACLFLSGCGPFLAISSVTSTALYLGYQQSKAGGIKILLDDFRVESKILALWKEAALDEPFLDVVVVRGVPVIIGAATSQDELEKAKAIAFVKSDNIQCLANTKMGSWNRDLALSVRFDLIAETEIAARNYTVRAIRNHVWIVGVAQTEREKRLVISKLETMKGVKTFNYYIIVKSDSLADGYVVRE